MRRVMDVKYGDFYDEVQQKINEENSDMDQWLHNYPDRKKSQRKACQHNSLSPLGKSSCCI